LDASESNVTIRDVDASFVKDKVVSAGENSIVNVENLRVKDSAIALVSKDGSILNNDSSEFDNVDLVLAVYNKKTEYKKPSISIRSIAVSPSLLGFKSVDGVLSIPDDRVEIQVHESKDILGRLYGKGFGVATKK